MYKYRNSLCRVVSPTHVACSLPWMCVRVEARSVLADLLYLTLVLEFVTSLLHFHCHLFLLLHSHIFFSTVTRYLSDNDVEVNDI